MLERYVTDEAQLPVAVMFKAELGCPLTEEKVYTEGLVELIEELTGKVLGISEERAVTVLLSVDFPELVAPVLLPVIGMGV